VRRKVIPGVDEIFHSLSLLAFALGITFEAEPVHLARKTVWVIGAFSRRKDTGMRMASDGTQQEKLESGRCMVMEVWNRQRFGLVVVDHRHERIDQIERG
jgi:hypothetical protein